MPRHILLAVRIGKASHAPAATAAWLARELDARITVLYVAVELETAPRVASLAGLDLETVRARMLAEARTRAETLAREALGDAPFDVVIGKGWVAAEVAATAERLGADLIITGPEGRSAVTSIILGDTTRDILRLAPCPVVVVPPAQSTR